MSHTCILKSALAAILLMILLTACGGGGGGEDNNTTSVPHVPTLYQAIYNGNYQYNTLFYIQNAPDDTDWSRWGILHSGDAYRLYFMQEGSDDILYQFSYNAGTGDYEYGYNSVTPISIAGIPADADTGSIAMSHTGAGDTSLTSYYLHMKSLTIPTRIYTYRYNGNSYVYERSYNITGSPADVDWTRWAMLYGQGASRIYTGKQGDDSTIYQFKYNATNQNYEWGGGGSVSTIGITGMPADSDTSDFAMLNNGTQYQFYYLNAQN